MSSMQALKMKQSVQSVLEVISPCSTLLPWRKDWRGQNKVRDDELGRKAQVMGWKKLSLATQKLQQSLHMYKLFS